jgi:signal transduction histidine kinase
MKSVPKLIKRFIGVMLLSTFLIFILNTIVLFFVALEQTPSGSPYVTADEIAASLSKTDSGYILDNTVQNELSKNDVWAIFIDNDMHQVVWHTDNLPKGIPTEYSLSDISNLTLGYIQDYPTYVGDGDNGIIVLGYPQNRYWKSMWPSWDYNFIAHLPQTVLIAFLCNVLLVFIIYITVTGRLIKSANPIINGLKGLTSNKHIIVKEKGVLSELAVSINQTSNTLQSQKRQLEKRETARANWIAGVSHDIRTPLSMVMGYAGQLENDANLSDSQRQKATVIVKQSERMKNLINDLNLASKLEYNMQPLSPTNENLISIVRQVVVDFINMDIDDKHPMEWQTDEALTLCPVNVDKKLIKRAISNLIQNSINHNEQGCNIYVSVIAENKSYSVIVSDDGIGATEEQIEKLNNSPHYMVCDENTTEQRRGLGLLIVKQIIAVHGGTTTIWHNSDGGFSVKLTLPMQE